MDRKYLRRLSKDYPNIQAAKAEMVNLKAILALPKGTEYFLSDLHGENEAFIHMLKSASGAIKRRIDMTIESAEKAINIKFAYSSVEFIFSLIRLRGLEKL